MNISIVRMLFFAKVFDGSMIMGLGDGSMKRDEFPFLGLKVKSHITFLSGHEAVIVKNGSRLCGTGAARASTAIQQNKAYWEIKVQQTGLWSCGVRIPIHFPSIP